MEDLNLDLLVFFPVNLTEIVAKIDCDPLGLFRDPLRVIVLENDLGVVGRGFIPAWGHSDEAVTRSTRLVVEVLPTDYLYVYLSRERRLPNLG